MAEIRKLRATLAGGSTHLIRLPANFDAEDVRLTLMGRSSPPVPGYDGEWIETEDRDWIRASAIVALAIPSEEMLTVGEVMNLSPEEQEEFYKRHPPSLPPNIPRPPS